MTREQTTAMIRTMMDKNHWTRKQVAEWLGINPQSLTNKFARCSFRADEFLTLLEHAK